MKNKKYIKTSLIEFLNENNQTIKFDDLVNSRLPIQIGSGTTTGNFNKEELIKMLRDLIKHNLFDYEFYYNWTKFGDEYWNIFETDVLDKMFENVDDTINTYLFFNNGYYDKPLSFKMKIDERTKWIDNWFQTNKLISDDLRNSYYNYREKYAGVDLK